MEVRCPNCEGTGRVAIIRTNDSFASLVPQLCNRPMSVTVAKAQILLASYQQRGAIGIVVRSMAHKLSATLCPECNGTGISLTLTFGGT